MFVDRIVMKSDGSVSSDTQYMSGEGSDERIIAIFQGPASIHVTAAEVFDADGRHVSYVVQDGVSLQSVASEQEAREVGLEWLETSVSMIEEDWA
jgi:hypothetical protein